MFELPFESSSCMSNGGSNGLFKHYSETPYCMRVFEYSIAFSRIMLLGDGSILRIEETSCSQRSVIISMPTSRGQVSTGRNARASIYKKSAVVDADPIMNASQSSSDDGYANQPYFTLVVDNT